MQSALHTLSLSAAVIWQKPEDLVAQKATCPERVLSSLAAAELYVTEHHTEA